MKKRLPFMGSIKILPLSHVDAPPYQFGSLKSVTSESVAQLIVDGSISALGVGKAKLAV